MKRERQIKIYLSVLLIIFVLMTFLLPLGKSTSELFNFNKREIPLGLSISSKVSNIKEEVTNTINKKYTVIYQDGLKDSVFKKEIYYNCPIDNIPKYKGNNTRKNYKFIGWIIEKEKDQIIYTANYEKSS